VPSASGDSKKARSSSSHIPTIAHSNKGEAGALSERAGDKALTLPAFDVAAAVGTSD